jgi:mannose-6-phosphate isomerase-like protein (cupin superfamily)
MIANEAIVKKPWGEYQTLFQSVKMKLKVITIKPGHRISLQRHRFRDEIWEVVAGVGHYEFENAIKHRLCCVLMSGETVTIPRSQWHRIKNTGKIDLVINEIQIGEPDENDIERKEDDYGRA